ncbi:MAG: thioredoxin [Planctomycetota bacterium]
MASEHVLEITDENFESEVVASGQPVLLDFWAEWCMPCRMLTPTIEEIAEEMAGKVKVGKLDTDAARETAMKFGISAIPTIILFQGGEEKKRLIGLKSKDDIVGALQELTAGAESA